MGNERDILDYENARLREACFDLEVENAGLRDSRPPLWLLPVTIAGAVCWGAFLGWLLIHIAGLALRSVGLI